MCYINVWYDYITRKDQKNYCAECLITHFPISEKKVRSTERAQLTATLCPKERIQAMLLSAPVTGSEMKGQKSIYYMSHVIRTTGVKSSQTQIIISQPSRTKTNNNSDNLYNAAMWACR